MVFLFMRQIRVISAIYSFLRGLEVHLGYLWGIVNISVFDLLGKGAV